MSYMELADVMEETNTAWIGEAERVFRETRLKFERVKKEVEDKERSDCERSSREALALDLW